MQNQVQQAISRLPQQVQQQGLRVRKSNPDFLLIAGVYDVTDKLTNVGRRPTISSPTFRTRSGACRASATPTCSARNMRCGSGSIPRGWRATQLMPERRGHRDHQPEYRGRGGRDRRPADAARRRCSTPPSPRSRGCRRPSSSREIILKTQPTARPCGSPTSPGSSWARRATPRSAGSTVTRARASRCCSRRAPTRWRPPNWSRRRSRASPRRFPPRLQDRLRQRHDRLHQAVDRGGREDADRGDHPRRHRHVRLPAELARDADPDDRGAGGAARHLRRVLPRRLLDQHADAVRAGPRDRPARRRRDRRRRECRAADGREPGHVAARGDDPVDEGDHASRWSRSRWCCRRCSCRWRSSADRPA